MGISLPVKQKDSHMYNYLNLLSREADAESVFFCDWCVAKPHVEEEVTLCLGQTIKEFAQGHIVTPCVHKTLIQICQIIGKLVF